jgi:hypothetical protein
MKTEISLLPAVVGAVIYLCALSLIFLYVIQSLSTVTIATDGIAEAFEMLL